MQVLLTNARHLSIDNRIWSKPPNRRITFLETKKSQKDNWRSVYATLIVYSMFWRQDPKQSFRTKNYSLSNQYKGRRHLKKKEKKRKEKTEMTTFMDPFRHDLTFCHPPLLSQPNTNCVNFAPLSENNKKSAILVAILFPLLQLMVSRYPTYQIQMLHTLVYLQID